MNQYDIILHFEWVHNSHIHKYLALNKSLNEKCNCLMIFNDGGLGIKKEDLSDFKKEDTRSILILDYDRIMTKLKSSKYKIYVSSGNGAKGHRYTLDIANTKSTTIQISDQMGDAGYCNLFNIYSLINPIMEKMSPYNKNQIWLSNCLLWDNISECLPYHLTKEEFCSKYGLSPEEDIYMWMPDNIQCQKGQAVTAYRSVCELKNIIIKLHPNEHKRHKSTTVNGKWSYELFSTEKVPILDPTDTYWSFKYVDCGFGYTSTIGLEFGLYRKPFVYLDHPSQNNSLPMPYIFNEDINSKHFGGQFSWVGNICESSRLQEFISDKRYVVNDDRLYDLHMKKFLAFPNRNAIDILTEQFLILLEKTQ